MTRLKKVLAALIAVVFAALSCLPGVLVLAENAQANTLSILSQTAEETPRYIHNVDEDKIIAFLDIETDVPGVTNRDVIYDVDLYNSGSQPIFPWTLYISPTVIGDTSPDGFFYVLDFTFVCRYELEYNVIDDDGIPYSFTTTEEHFPDVYGVVDLAGTSTHYLSTPRPGQTHVYGVITDNCPDLISIEFHGQEYCTELSAVNCPNLESVIATECNYQSIAVQPKGFERPVTARVEGSGSIGFTYTESSGFYVLYAEDTADFRGWYNADGRLISRSTTVILDSDEIVDAVACYTDCFGINGDVDGDGKVTVADAVLVARYAISVGELSNEGNALQLADFNCDGFVNIVDATLIARAALGLG